MKKILYIIGAILAMVSCTQEMADDITTLDGAVSFTTSNSITRATAKKNWADGGSVGIYSKSGSDIIDTNIEYTATNGTPVKFTAATTADQICYTSLDGELSFVAYYPFNEDNTDEKIIINLEEDQDDILVSSVEKATQSTTAVDFTFSHILSMVSIEISASDQITDLSDLRIFIADSYTSATYDLYSPALTVDNEADSHKGHIEMSIDVDGTTATATAFVMPYTYSSDKIIFYVEVNKRTFLYEMQPTWVAGTIYSYSATVGYDCFDITPTDIKGWEAGNSVVDICYDEDDDTYCINTGKGLAAFRDLVNGAGSNTSGATYWGRSDKFDFTQKNRNIDGKLMDDISLSDVCSSSSGKSWIPIGTYTDSKYYYGTFDGDGKTVSDLYINNSESDNQGLFGYCNGSAEIRCLSVSGEVRSSSKYVGGLVGFADGTSVNKTYIYDCYSSVNVSGKGTYAGGLVGQLGTYATIRNCSSSGSVSGTSNYSGGLVGKTENATIINSYYDGSIGVEAAQNVVSGDCIGGLVGYNTEGSTIVNCYSIVYELYATDVSGGLVGQNGYGDDDTSSIENCYCVVLYEMSGNAKGGVVGVNRNTTEATVTKCYYDNDTMSSEKGVEHGIGASSGGTNNSAEGKSTDVLGSFAATLTSNAAAYNTTASTSDIKAYAWEDGSGLYSYPCLTFYEAKSTTN